MNNFALKNYGANSQPIEMYSRQGAFIKQFTVREEEYAFKRDKKLDVIYRVAFRYKNNEEKREGVNNEVMQLEVDMNLSPDFTFTHVDMVTQKALTISVFQIHQPRTYHTKIRVMESYVDENQELFENRTGFSIDTLPGTLAKRMSNYKSEFDKWCKFRVGEYLDKGFETRETHLLSNFSDYLLLKWKEHSGHRIADINKYLTMYSALHDDCFHGKELEYDYHRFPYSFVDRETGYVPKKPFLFAYQVEMLDEIDSFYNKNCRAFEEMHNKNCSKYWSGSKLKYYEFKKDFLEMWDGRNNG